MMALEHEELHVRRGERTGLYVIVAVHSTALGPALGGARLWRYKAPGDGVADALRLSEAMTMKAAAAGLDLGGGKCVVCAEGELDPARRGELMLDLGDTVEALDGRYVTAEDVGTSPADMEVIAERTGHVVGLPRASGGQGDPSPLTARGVAAAIEASLHHATGDASPAGRRVCVVGLGHVGQALAELLAARGAELVISDIDEGARARAELLGADWVDPAVAIEHPCDVLAPCALGGAIDAANVDRIRAEIVCGSANNVLAEDSLAAELDLRGVLYAPDFIANAGGLIGVASEWRGANHATALEAVDEIGEALTRVFERAAGSDATPLAAAREIARERLAGAVAA